VTTVKGLDLVQKNLRRVREGWPREQSRILEDVAEPLIREAKARVRVDTGRLRSSIRQMMTVDAVEIFTDVPYARFQHYGTVYVEPNPFLTGPLHEMESETVRDFDDLTWRFVDRVWVDN
jgi:hypothetical protein